MELFQKVSAITAIVLRKRLITDLLNNWRGGEEMKLHITLPEICGFQTHFQLLYMLTHQLLDVLVTQLGVTLELFVAQHFI